MLVLHVAVDSRFHQMALWDLLPGLDILDF